MSEYSGRMEWHICGTPSGVQRYAHDFTGDIQQGPWLVLVWPHDRVTILEREAIVGIMNGFMDACNQIIRGVEHVDPDTSQYRN